MIHLSLFALFFHLRRDLIRNLIQSSTESRAAVILQTALRIKTIAVAWFEVEPTAELALKSAYLLHGGLLLICAN